MAMSNSYIDPDWTAKVSVPVKRVGDEGVLWAEVEHKLGWRPALVADRPRRRK